MLATLLESQHRRSRNIEFQLVSAAVHTALIVGAVVATGGVVQARYAPETTTRVVYSPPRPTPIAEALPAPTLPSVAGISTFPIIVRVPDVLPEIGIVRNLFLTDPKDCIAACPLVGVTANPPVTGPQAMTAEQVERVAFLRSGTGRPVYPEALRSAGVEGDVIVQFVIDTIGRAEMSTLKILSSSNERFTLAATQALKTARFVPAEFGGRRVRQVVQMPFVFSLKK